MINLRDYQEESLDRIWNYFASGNTGNPVVALPTGTGKSLIPAVFIERIMKIWPDQRFLLATHVKELIAQNFIELKNAWPDAPAGIYSAGLKKKQPFFPIVFGGIQSMIKNVHQFGHRDIAFVDEAHLVSQEEGSMYLTFFEMLRLINPRLKIIGLTATPYRMGQGYITDDGLFTDIIHDMTSMENFNQLIAQGYMAPLIPKRTHTELDISDVGMQKGEFIPAQLEHAVDQQRITYAGLKEMIDYGSNRKSWLIFSSGISHAEHIATMLSTFGIDCAAVHSKQKPEYNDAAITAFKNYSLRAIVCYSKLTTGFNHPGIDLIGDFRPTMSIPLHVQKLGRGTRPANGKENCILKGSLVLTNVGLIPIEKITIKMKVWDGWEFVSHNGIICNGVQKVIEYAGLAATLDHRVWTQNGWQTLQSCYERKIPIASTANGWNAIWQIENNFITNSLQRRNYKASIYFNRMSNLFISKFKRILECENVKCGLSSLWEQSCMASSSKMVTSTLHCSKRQMHQQKQSSLYGLWRQGNTVQIYKSNSNGYLDYAKSWITQRIGSRSYSQRLPLRNWQSKIFNKIREYAKSTKIQSERQTPRIFNGVVYDILNCGPRNQFTVNNLLVHNCLVLDFSRNVPRLGPINDPVIPRKKGEKTGDIPVKICESCGAYNHIKARFCCDCNSEFDFRVKIFKSASTDEIIKSDLPVVEIFQIDRVIYARGKKEPKPAYIKVSYHSGLRMFSQFVFPEHGGYPTKLFRDWWRQRHTSEPPSKTDEALGVIKELRTPRQMRVWVNKKMPEILSVEF